MGVKIWICFRITSRRIFAASSTNSEAQISNNCSKNSISYSSLYAYQIKVKNPKTIDAVEALTENIQIVSILI